MLVALHFRLFSFLLCFLGLISSVSTTLNTTWVADESHAEVDADCADVSDACQEPMKWTNMDQFNACADSLAQGCQLTGYEFSAPITISCDQSATGRWGSNFAAGDFNELQITGLRLGYFSAELGMYCNLPKIIYSITAPADPDKCYATSDAKEITKGFTFNSDLGIVYDADLGTLSSLSVVARQLLPDNTIDEGPCPIVEIAPFLRVTRVVQGRKTGGGGDGSGSGGGNGSGSGADLVFQLGTTRFVGVLTMIGLIILQSIF